MHPHLAMPMTTTKRPSSETVHVITPQGDSIPAVSLIGSDGEEAVVGEFGDLVTTQRRDYIALKFGYGISERNLYHGGTGSHAETTPGSKLRLDTGVTSASTVYAQSDETIIYRPGHASYLLVTPIFYGLTADSIHRVGAYTVTPTLGSQTIMDGLLLHRRGGIWYVELWSDGVMLMGVAQSAWDDPLDGEGQSRYRWDPGFGNVLRMTWGYLGFAPVRFYMDTDVGLINFHTIDRRNRSTALNFGLPFLPFRAEVLNGATAASSSLEIGSVNGGVMADAQADPEAKHFAKSGTQSITGSPTVFVNILTLKPDATFFGKVNYIRHTMSFLSMATDGTKTFNFKVIKNATLSGTPVYTQIDAVESPMRSTNDASTVTGGHEMLSIQLSKVNNETIKIDDHLEYMLGPEDTLTVCAQTTVTGDASCGVRWHEFF